MLRLLFVQFTFLSQRNAALYAEHNNINIIKVLKFVRNVLPFLTGENTLLG